MRDIMERFVLVPFSIGCASESSVAVVTSQPKKPKSAESNLPAATRKQEEESSSKGRMKSSFGFQSLPKPNISFGIQKLIKSFKSISQYFVYKEEIEKVDTEMVIGFPTDVKHVTHIGLDGSTTTNPVKGWENLKTPEIISFPSISLRQLELAMAAQAHHGPPVVDPSKLD